MRNDQKVRERIDECSSKHLPRLDLSNCELSTIPNEVFSLTHLVELNLGGWLTNNYNTNKIIEISPNIERLENLEKLSLANNLIQTLPTNIHQLKNLRYLDLGNNRLDELPPAITKLTNLQQLILNGNLLRLLPLAIADLSKLERLIVSHNHIHALPESFSLLKDLQILSLAYNRLTSVPLSIVQLSNLKTLSLEGNPLEYPPPEIAKHGIRAIRTYFQEMGENLTHADRLYEAKLLLIGEGRVGKTSLAKSLSFSDYMLEDEQSTEGIAVQPWIIPKHELGINKDFRLNIWDFGGQEIYHATHQFFLTKRSLYILVTESRKEDKHDDFYYWLNTVRILGDRSPIVIVLNKCDQPTKELPINEYQQNFENIVCLCRVSCHPDYRDTIGALKLEIGRILTNKSLLPHVGTELPKVWIDIREKIENLQMSGYDFISYDEYLDLCKKYGMNEDRSDFLSEFFHDLGIFLHFRDDLSLNDTIFLNHEWVTDGVYKVLDNEIVKASYGRFNDSDLAHIWHDKKYKYKRKELLALMKNRKFELCYDLPSGGYLAPQLLPVDEKNYEWRSHSNNLHFEYRYHFLPKGILARFIVKRHLEIHQQTHWRYGVLLEFENTRALVRERYFDRKLTIILEGENKKGFLDIIRKTIQEINSTFNNLEVDEMIPCNCAMCRQSNTPSFYRYRLLVRYTQAGKRYITCENSLEDVNVNSLISDVIILESERTEWIEREWGIQIQNAHFYDQIVDTGGGSFIAGDVKTKGGDFTGRDQHASLSTANRHRRSTKKNQKQ